MPRCSDSRERLLAAACKLVHERGYAAVSVADLCQEAELKKGSFYHFFPSKRDLVLAVIDLYGERQRQEFAASLDPSLPAREQLQRMFDRAHEGLVESQRADGCVRGCALGNLALEMSDRDEEIRQKLASVMAGFEHAMANVVRLGAERGEFRVSDPKQVARAMVAYFEGAIMMAKSSNDPEVFAQLAPSAFAFLDSGEVSVQRGATAP